MGKYEARITKQTLLWESLEKIVEHAMEMSLKIRLKIFNGLLAI